MPRVAGAFPAVAGATVGGAILAGAYVERCSFRPLIRQAPVVAMISSFAVSMQLQELVALGSPSRTIPYPAPAWLPAEARKSKGHFQPLPARPPGPRELHRPV